MYINKTTFEHTVKVTFQQKSHFLLIDFYVLGIKMFVRKASIVIREKRL